ncbi:MULTISPECIES: alpha/beta fold hydrolase [unclassified Arthrobacter]|uniref:alpha/beta fold hydrolase n=1 Tax=unclassified Arthrobacter TaxID=235627 RepID=UPI00159E723C|nr:MULTISPECIES: alpha/beta fold hydrolase [unclassified Arthrobacter]MCQ9165999.1 alpha/beta hydrolase [Arthrobacter sp. STN4]NVN00701.1 alpha/beta fold hydrolase [Arthrobacter sp. SDTb3-6]
MSNETRAGTAVETRVPEIRAVLLSPQRPLGSLPLLVVGCSLGTSSVLWEKVGVLLGGEVDVVAWDLPGHGISPASQAPFTVAGLADAVVALVDSIAPGARFHYAGVSLGGAVGLQLGIDHDARLLSLSVQCSGPKLGTPEAWTERAGTVRTLGTPVMIQGSAQRWFAEGSMERDPALASRLLNALRDADRFSYAHCCGALAGFDVRNDLGRITAPMLGVAGVEDTVAPPEMVQEMVDAINAGAAAVSAPDTPPAVAVTLLQVSHLAPAEAPAEVADLLRGLMERGRA